MLISFHSQSQVVEAWVARYNRESYSSDAGKDIAAGPDRSVYVTGSSTFATTNASGTVIHNRDITTIRYSSTGQELWVKSYNGPANKNDYAEAMTTDANGNVYVTGYSESGPEDEDIITIKYDRDGNLIWVARYNGPALKNDRAAAIAVDGSGNVYVTGEQDGDVFNNLTDIITIKYNSAGVQQWANKYAGAANRRDNGSAIVVKNGFAYITGGLVETGTKSDYIIIKYSTAGSIAWIQSYDGPEHKNDFANDIGVDGSGNVYVTGTSEGETPDPIGNDEDFLTVKYDADGNHVWNKRYHNVDLDGAGKLVIDGQNNIIVTGTSVNDQAYDIYTLKYDGNGNKLWSDRFHRDYNDSDYDMAIDNAGNIYITGYSDRPNDPSLNVTDYVTIKYTPGGLREWAKYYQGISKENTGVAIAVNANQDVFVTGISEETSSYGDNAIATIKYVRCILVCPSNIVVNNKEGQCDAIVNYPEATTTGHCGLLAYSKASGTAFPVGVTTVTVRSPSTGETCTFTVTVNDIEAPKITCPAPLTVSCAANVPAVDINSVTATDNCSIPTVTHVGDVISNQTCANRFTVTRTYKATDGSGNTATCAQVITVNDITPPQINGLSLSQQSLWPPNHTMRDITVNYTITDNCVDNPSVVVSVTSNEPVNGTADGDTDPDWEIVDLHHIKLRAERASNGNGRIYTITVTVDDGCNPKVSQSKQVYVAHNITGPQTGQPFKIGSVVPFTGVFWDKPGNTHTAKWLLDGSGIANGTVTEPSGNQNGKVTGTYKFNTPGVYKLQMNVTDQSGVTSYANTNNDLDAIVVIYDPNGGNAYGGGWFQSQPGALANNSAAQGKASYGFAVNYKNTAKPKGETQFEFKVGDFEFNALNFDYLSINNAKAQFKGTGKIIGGQSGIGFIMTVTDGAIDGSGADKIRMKIYNRNNGTVYYDNQPGANDVSDPTTVVGVNSSIVIQDAASVNNNLTKETTTLESQASITCPGNKVVSPDPGSCMATVYNIDPVYAPSGAVVAYHIIGPQGPSTGYGSVSGFAFPIGISTVRYNLPDFIGVNCEFTITVEDKTPPVITCPANLTLKCPDEIPLPEPFTVIDPCTPSGYLTAQFVSDVKSNETCANKFTITRTYKATDASGNTSTCAQIITVNDDVPPSFDQGKPISPLNFACPFQVTVPDNFTARDQCYEEYAGVVFKEVRTNGSCDNRYTLTRTWTATDLCGNTAVYTQIVNVKDTVPPTFTSIPNRMNLVSCASEIPTAPHLFAEDNCYDLSNLPVVTLKEDTTNKLCANNFKLTRTWTATDACGNTTTVSQIFVVLDVSRPVFQGVEPLPVMVSCEKEIPAAPTQTATDNCGGGNVTITLSETKTNVQCANRFTLTRKWLASDACGNTATRTQTITVSDLEPPKVTAISVDNAVLWPPNHKMRDVTINYTATDNCGVTAKLEVSSSDPISGGSDGDQSPDWEVVDEHHVRLRAEKANNGQARYYDIKITVTDGCNASFDTTITVVVAHNITSPQTGHPYKVGSTVSLNGVFWDKPGNTHTAKWLLDGSAAANGTVTEPSGNQNGKVTGSYKFNTPGVYKLQMNVTDQAGITSYANTNNDLDAIVVIYDPNGGNAYGGGWFHSAAGALAGNATAEGKASYGFAVNYKNAAKPKGETQFEFKVGDFEFNALNFDYLAINDAKAQFRGTGKIVGGQSGIGFIMTVTDGQLDGSSADKIRMKIYNRNTGFVYYDNQPGVSDANDPTTIVGTNSSIVIQGAATGEPMTQAIKTESQVESADQKVPQLEVIAYPNPSNKHFSIQVRSDDGTTKLTMQVFDNNGRLLETRANLTAGTMIQLGERYKAGVYYVRITQGRQHGEVKLIKF